MRVPALLLILALTAPATAEPRRIAFWPDTVPMTIQSHVDRAYVLGAGRSLGKFHRVQGSPGFRAAADWLVGELKSRGLADAAVEHLPADGKTRYAQFRSYLGWTASEGRLDEVVPRLRRLGDFATQPVALADYSQDADVSTELAYGCTRVTVLAVKSLNRSCPVSGAAGAGGICSELTKDRWRLSNIRS